MTLNPEQPLTPAQLALRWCQAARRDPIVEQFLERLRSLPDVTFIVELIGGTTATIASSSCLPAVVDMMHHLTHAAEINGGRLAGPACDATKREIRSVAVQAGLVYGYIGQLDAESINYRFAWHVTGDTIVRLNTSCGDHSESFSDHYGPSNQYDLMGYLLFDEIDRTLNVHEFYPSMETVT